MADTTISGLPYISNTNNLTSCVIPVSDGLITSKANLSSFPLISSGTFTPRYAANNGALGSITYAYQFGKYYRIGDLVHIWLEIATSSYSIPRPAVIPNELFVEIPGTPIAWNNGSGIVATSQTMQCNNWFGYDGASIYHPHSAALQVSLQQNRIILGRGRHTLPNPANGSGTNNGDAYGNDFLWCTDLTNHTSDVRNECRFSMTYTTS
jgi:hypothetical protein